MESSNLDEALVLEELFEHNYQQSSRISEAEPTEEFVIWYDAINNSLSPHFNNFDSPLTRPELADSLKTVSSRIRSIIYCQRTETSNINRDLKNHGLPVVDVVKDIASRKGDISEEIKQLYKLLHQPSALELKTYYVVLRYDGYEQKICKKKTRLSALRSRNFKLKKLADQELYRIPENFRIYLNPGQARKLRKKLKQSKQKPTNLRRIFKTQRLKSVITVS